MGGWRGGAALERLTARIPLALLLAQRLELAESGVFFAIPVTSTVFALVSAALFRRSSWKVKVV